LTPQNSTAVQDTSRARKLQALGILSGFTAGAWLGAAEAPTKLVSIGVSPMVISLIMVVGVFLARWSLPASWRQPIRRMGIYVFTPKRSTNCGNGPWRTSRD